MAGPAPKKPSTATPPSDPLELAKMGSETAGTRVMAQSAVAPEPPPEPEAPKSESLPPPPAPPPPPAVKEQKYLVLNDKIVRIGNAGWQSTQLRKGKIVSNHSYDIEQLRAQGVLLQPMPE